jgi:hypothetical protein
MNLTRALDVALPDIPARMISQHAPRLHPEVVSKEHIVDGYPIIRAYVPGVEAIFNFPPQDWKLIQLFDGARTYEEIAQKYHGNMALRSQSKTCEKLPTNWNPSSSGTRLRRKKIFF